MPKNINFSIPDIRLSIIILNIEIVFGIGISYLNYVFLGKQHTFLRFYNREQYTFSFKDSKCQKYHTASLYSGFSKSRIGCQWH